MQVDQAIKQYLEAQPAVMALLPGGIWMTDIGLKTTPAAYDANGELLTCIRIRLETVTPFGNRSENPHGKLQLRTPAALYFLRQLGYDGIRAAMDAVLPVLDGVKLTSLNGVGRVAFADQVGELSLDAIQRAQAMMRFYVYHEAA